MRPLPQTTATARALTALTGEQDLLTGLQDAADAVERIVPECIGLSVGWWEDGLVFTLVASAERVALLVGAPEPSTGAGAPPPEEAVLDEERWRRLTVCPEGGVRSSLTYPLREQGCIVGTINMYAASGSAFETHHEDLARLLGARAPEAVRNADLSFDTRRDAEEAPARLHELDLVNMAVGIVAARDDVDVVEARRRLDADAARTGTSTARLAAEVVDQHRR